MPFLVPVPDRLSPIERADDPAGVARRLTNPDPVSDMGTWRGSGRPRGRIRRPFFVRASIEELKSPVLRELVSSGVGRSPMPTSRRAITLFAGRAGVSPADDSPRAWGAVETAGGACCPGAASSDGRAAKLRQFASLRQRVPPGPGPRSQRTAAHLLAAAPPTTKGGAAWLAFGDVAEILPVSPARRTSRPSRGVSREPSQGGVRAGVRSFPSRRSSPHGRILGK